MSRRSYNDLIVLNTIEERFDYLKLSGVIGVQTFGGSRYLNQRFYQQNPMWKKVRNDVIIRDNGCDLGVPGYEIPNDQIIVVHHINPISIDDVLNNRSCLYDLDNLICVSDLTHKALHYGNKDLLPPKPVERYKGDTCPWL